MRSGGALSCPAKVNNTFKNRARMDGLRANTSSGTRPTHQDAPKYTSRPAEITWMGESIPKPTWATTMYTDTLVSSIQKACCRSSALQHSNGDGA